MDPSAIVLEKIRSADLRSEAVADAPQPHLVIVELKLPRPTLEMTEPRPDGLRPGRARLRFAAAGAASAEVERQIADTSERIEAITGKAPETFLSTSGSFVVEANGAQIGRIADLPSVSAIWPNTRRIVEEHDGRR
ncbi:MAG TPA: hypothetical protein VF641_09230 [Methylobacterium sp.]|jgi:hypothetical protein